MKPLNILSLIMYMALLFPLSLQAKDVLKLSYFSKGTKSEIKYRIYSEKTSSVDLAEKIRIEKIENNNREVRKTINEKEQNACLEQAQKIIQDLKNDPKKKCSDFAHLIIYDNPEEQVCREDFGHGLKTISLIKLFEKLLK